MKSQDFLDILNEADESLLTRCDTDRKPIAKRIWKPLTTIAAVFAVAIIGVGAWSFIFAANGAGAGGGGRGGSLEYMNYIGPVLPLTSLDDTDDITAERAVDFDFYDYVAPYSGAVGVTDSYTLTNTSAEDRTFTLSYPLSERLNTYADRLPQITVDGKLIELSYYPGAYTGGYMGVWGAKDPEGTVNMAPLSSFEEYRALLSDDTYMEMALSGYPTLDQQVIVYEITDPIILTEEGKRGANPSLAIEFISDSEKTVVMTYGMNGMHRNPKKNYSRHSFGVNQPGQVHYGEPEFAYVILMGEDIEGYTIQGYEDGGCDKGEEIDITATVNRYEMTLGEFLMARITENRADRDSTDEYATIGDAIITDEVYLGLAAELLLRDGILSENGVERYQWGRLDDILSAVRTDGRILYLTFEVTVPAGGSITIDCRMKRDAHMDYVGDKAGLAGYDMATRLGSSLNFTRQSASISHTESIEIIDQNFGFDLTADITEVTLDPEVDHYWMEVRRIHTKNTPKE